MYEVGSEPFDGLDRDVLTGEPPIVQSRGPERWLHRLVEGRIVGGRHRMERDPHELGLDDRVLGKCAVQARAVETDQSGPQREVWRSRLLRLERDDLLDTLDGVEWSTTQ